MTDYPISVVWTTLIILAIYLIRALYYFGQREKNLPPGPPTLPILGNAHLIPAKNLHVKLKEWSDIYGSVFSLKIGKGTFIVLNSRKAVHDLVDKKSAIYLDRPLDYNIEVALGGENLAFMHADSLWRAQRKIASQNLAPKLLDEKVVVIQEAEFNQLAHDFLETPDRFIEHIERTTASMASIMLYGFRAPTFDNFWATCVHRAMALLNVTIAPGSYLPIEHFPILKLIPDSWAPSKRNSRIMYTKNTAIWTEARERVEERRRNGDIRISLADRLLGEEVKPDVEFTYSQMNNFLGSVHQGAADTTSSAMMTIMLFLAKHPEVQKKARLEIDRVCGTDRMPTWEDFKDLPYINCIVKEGLRIRPLIPTGVPHRVRQDDWYDGMLIPKDATVFVNAYAIHNNMDDDSETFNPDRYLGRPRLAMDYAGSPDYENRDHYSYGAGRRICVGIHLAERTQWRFVARVIWGFNIEPEIDGKTGEKIELDSNAYTDGFVRQPLPFKLRITPRSVKHSDVIKRDFKGVGEYLKKWE